jgi:hypothetical protein
VSLPLILCKSASQNPNSALKIQIEMNVLNWSDKVNILDLLEGGVCLAEMAPTEQN